MKRVLVFLLGVVTGLLFRKQIGGLARQGVKGAVGLRHQLTRIASEAMEDLQDAVAEADHEISRAAAQPSNGSGGPSAGNPS